MPAASQSERIWELLSRGGLPRESAREAVMGAPPGPLGRLRIPKYDGLADPSGAEELGRLLAERARSLNPTAVLLWEDPQDVVLGHVVARELGIQAYRSFDQEGLIEVAGGLPPDRRVLILADAFREAGVLRAMCLVVTQRAGTVVATAALAASPALAEAGAGERIALVNDLQDALDGNGTR